MKYGYWGKKCGAGVLAILPFTATANEVQAQQTTPVQIPTVTVRGFHISDSSWEHLSAGFLDQEGSYDITCGLHVAYVSARGPQDTAIVFPTRDDSIIVQVKGVSIKFSGRVQQKPPDVSSKEALNDTIGGYGLINFCTSVDIAYTMQPDNNPLDVSGTKYRVTTKTITVSLPTGPIGYKQTNYGRAIKLALGQVD